MSHVTKQSERDTNQEITECMERNKTGKWVEYGVNIDGNTDYMWVVDWDCVPSIDIDPAHGKCPKCGKVFTY